MQSVSDVLDLGGPSPEALRPEFDGLTTEQIRDDLRDLDSFSTMRMAEVMNAEDRGVPIAVAEVLPAITIAIDAIVERMRRGGRLIYVGAGTPGRLGVLDASECPPTFDTDPELVVGIIAGGDLAIRDAVEGAEDDPDAGSADLAAVDLRAEDTVVGISASGRTPYVAGAIEYAHRTGALAVAVACNRGSAIGALADHAIEVIVGPEVLAGSTRLKAGTAQKLVLNMISTIVMVRLGKTFGNVMVDLQATNDKLRDRARRLVMLVTGRSAADASQALEQAGWSVKAAVLILARGLTAEEAEQVLQVTPNLRAVLEGRV
ncbi:MAG TPA: N-acetylmuramic acid 6-phosphate etherase [Pseudolysinimonas sp.]|jgi:N-acetylmuramic acid 6-phosphate etherase